MLHDPSARCLEISQPLRQSWARDLIPSSSLSISLIHINTNQNSNSTFEDTEVYSKYFQLPFLFGKRWQPWMKLSFQSAPVWSLQQNWFFSVSFLFLKQGFFRNIGKTFGPILLPAFASWTYNSIRLPPDGTCKCSPDTVLQSPKPTQEKEKVEFAIWSLCHWLSHNLGYDTGGFSYF